MAGKLLTLSQEFFDDLEAQTIDMQFSGGSKVAWIRLLGLRGQGFPVTWSDLVRWPVQCECGYVAEFAVGWYVTQLACPRCLHSYWSDDLHARMLVKKVSKRRFAMLVAVTNGGSTMGENAVLALRGIKRLTGDDVDSLQAAAEDLALTRSYRRLK